MSDQRFCLCGCGELVKNKWVRGHHSRVNNISKRPDIREKRKQQMQERHDSGEWQPWNKGVSDKRTKKNGQAIAKARGKSWRKNVAKSRKEGIEKGSIIPVAGKRHGKWKGGSSTLIQRLRSSHQLYKLWKRPILERDGFKCVECGYTKKLQVHHDKEKMSFIVHKFVDKNSSKRNFEEDSVIVEQIVQYHIENNVSGKTLCAYCHKTRH